MSPGLGRVPFYDSRNERFRIRAIAPAPAPQITQRYWYDVGWQGDQMATSQCTAYSLLHYMADGPVTHPNLNPIRAPSQLYAAIQAKDRAEGRDYGVDGGATMLAQSKAAIALGWYGEYRWGYTLDELVNAILTTGPVILGINWYAGMMNPKPTGRVAVTGEIVGGHAIVANGVNVTKETIRLKNSWGLSYGLRGHCYLSFQDMNRLIAEDGEIVLPRELKTFTPVA